VFSKHRNRLVAVFFAFCSLPIGEGEGVFASFSTTKTPIFDKPDKKFENFCDFVLQYGKKLYKIYLGIV
jgi:hypothetical protein